MLLMHTIIIHLSIRCFRAKEKYIMTSTIIIHALKREGTVYLHCIIDVHAKPIIGLFG